MRRAHHAVERPSGGGGRAASFGGGGGGGGGAVGRICCLDIFGFEVFECNGFESSTHSHAELLQRAQAQRANIERLQAEEAKRQARREPGPGPAVVIAYGQVGQQASLLDAAHAQEELSRRERL